MKLLATLITCVICGCATIQRDLPHKAWHHSPSVDSRSSTVYPFVSWDVLAKVKVGMSESQAQAAIGSPLQYYHHPTNAIVFSRLPDGRDVEVAMKRSPSGAIEDISFRFR